ncbi:MAG: gfo/Idh/MocA family oxidoreductase, partial [Planctomycetaceae bacterium]
KADRRELAMKMFPAMKKEMVFADWREFVALGKVADAVIIATMENLHEPIAVACAELGYHILLEKPMAPTAQACRNIVAAAKKAGVIFAVCHELRYAPFYQKIRSIIAGGTLGEIVHIQHAEDVSYWHFSHSFVRGHNRNSKQTSFSLLSKSCHDVDIIRFLMGRRCLSVQSFGGLMHFTKSAKPVAAGDAARCTDCQFEPQCPFSAVKIYIHQGVNIGADAMPGESISRKFSTDELWKVLRTGPMGRCVYECDNDVADHQIVNFSYDGGRTASFTMSGFTEGGRVTSVHGTKGILRGELTKAVLRRYDFLTDKWHDESITDEAAKGGHGGGDAVLMQQWLDAIASGDQSKLITGPDETLETHLATFAAEQSRLDGEVKPIA